jgi:hypothetical protein
MAGLTVWKYELPITDGVDLLMPDGAEVLLVGNQYPVNISTITLWVRCDPEAPKRTRHFTIVGTGNPATSAPHVGSVIMAGGSLVWHVFDDGYK